MFLRQLFTAPIHFFSDIIIIIISIVVHELAHGLAAIHQGDDTPIKKGHITLNPVIHMGWPSLIFLAMSGMTWGQMPVDPHKFRHYKWSDILVSAAGPIANLILGFICLILLKINLALGLDRFSSDFFYKAAIINFTLCFFNLIPCPPLDGFHILAQFFPQLKVHANSPWTLFALIILFNMGLGALLSGWSQAIVYRAIAGS